VTAAQDLTTLSGTVRSLNGESLSGVTVQIKGLGIISQTSQDGSYFLNQVPLNVTVTYSRLGYKTLDLSMGLLSSVENIQNVILFPEIRSLDEINITERFNGSNFITLEPGKFSSFPSTSGSFEGLIKSLPGVSPNNELSAQYAVRGGNYDENLVYLNDIEIFRPMLLSRGQQEGLGFVNPEIAGSIRFSAGGFEARYGDKLSSVLDVRYSRPDSFSLAASAALLGSSATLKVPFRKSYLLAGARKKRNQELLQEQQISGGYNSQFSDYQLYYKHNFTDKFNVSLFGNYSKGDQLIQPKSRQTEFGTTDEVLKLQVSYEGEEASDYESMIGAITLAYNFSNVLSIKWINSITDISENIHSDLLGWYWFDERDGLGGDKSGNFLGRGTQLDYTNSSLNTRIYNSEIRLHKQFRKSFFEFGLKTQYDRISEDINEFTSVDSTGYTQPGSGNWIINDIINERNSINIDRIKGFLQNTFSFNPNFTLTAGLRTNYNSYTDEILVSPRLSVVYFPDKSDRLMLRFSAGSYDQAPYYRELKNYNGSLNRDAISQRSYQLLAGSGYKFDGLGTKLNLSSEIYYKFLYRITPYKTEDLQIRYFADQRSKGYAAGADFSLSGNFAKNLESTFRVSLMRTKEDIAGDVYDDTGTSGNPDAVYPGYIRRPSDQLINIGILFQDHLQQNPTYKVHLNLAYASGLPVGPAGAQRYQDVFKIPAYKRVDIGFSKDFADPDSKRIIPFVKKYFQSLSLHAEVFNLLNMKNTASYLWLRDVNSVQYAVPNYLTFRKLNLRVAAKLKSR
jgi:hypothetical protein